MCNSIYFIEYAPSNAFLKALYVGHFSHRSSYHPIYLPVLIQPSTRYHLFDVPFFPRLGHFGIRSTLVLPRLYRFGIRSTLVFLDSPQSARSPQHWPFIFAH